MITIIIIILSQMRLNAVTRSCCLQPELFHFFWSRAEVSAGNTRSRYQSLSRNRHRRLGQNGVSHIPAEMNVAANIISGQYRANHPHPPPSPVSPSPVSNIAWASWGKKRCQYDQWSESMYIMSSESSKPTEIRTVSLWSNRVIRSQRLAQMRFSTTSGNQKT